METTKRPPREVQRVRERRARERRATTLDAMYRQVRQLEQVQVALVAFPEHATAWKDFMDADTQKAMVQHRRIAQAKAETLRLKAENRLVQRMLTEYVLVHRVVEGLASKAPPVLDTWSQKVARWRTQAERHYRPLTNKDFEELVRASLHEKQRLEMMAEMQENEPKVRGWSDNRRILPDTHTFRFTARKLIQNVDPQEAKDIAWAMFADPEVYAKVVRGGRGNFSLEVQQQISPDAHVMRVFEVYDQHLGMTVQYMYLQFRVQTDKGLVQFFESLPASSALRDESSVWPSFFCWVQIETLTSRDVRITSTGRIQSEDQAFTNYWCSQELGAVLRAEEMLTGKLLLRF